MTDEFTKMFTAMVEQGQEMARAFNPALENVHGQGVRDDVPDHVRRT